MMTITITQPQTASRRARYAAFAALIAVAATMIGYGIVQTMTDDPARTTSTPADLEVSSQLADWARANGVVGLSPASATANTDVDVSGQLADWARANGVVGLSPASATATAPA
jgi:post-segregation antitoxin (ccd killing protein)